MSGATGSGLEQEDAGIGASQLLFGKKSLISCVHIVVLRLLQNTTRHLADASFKRAYSIETEKKKKKEEKHGVANRKYIWVRKVRTHMDYKNV